MEFISYVQPIKPDLEQEMYDRTAELQQALSVEESLRHLTGNLLQCLDETEVLYAALQELSVVLDVVGGNTIRYRHRSANRDQSWQQLGGETRPLLDVVSEYMAGDLDLSGLILTEEQFIEHIAQRMEGQSYQICIPVQSLHNRWYNVLFCPIIDDNGILLGDIMMLRTRDHCFNDDEIHFIQQVADQCAIAIRQSNLYQSAQRQVEELERLNQLKDDFLSTISHELRTPMSNVQMGLDALERHLNVLRSTFAQSDEQVAQQWRMIDQCLTILKTESQQEIALIGDLLDLSRLEAGTEPFLPSTLQLQPWLSHIVEVFHPQLREHKQHLIINVPRHLAPLTTDFGLLERIVTELLQNACKYTPAGRCIIISAQIQSSGQIQPGVAQPSHQLSRLTSVDQRNLDPYYPRPTQTAVSEVMQLQVSNTGIEIPWEECDRIFDKFYRIPSNDPWKYGGTGLGLALVKRLVTHLNGTIHATSMNNQVNLIIQLPILPPHYRRG